MDYTKEIDWNTARVEPAADGLRLHVDVGPIPPDSFWRHAFYEVQDIFTRGIGRAFEAVTVTDSTITAFGVEKGREENVRSQLDDLVDRTNTAAVKLRDATVRQSDAQQQAEEQRASEAEEMTHRFRAGGV
jgi:hypothetical protein